MQKVLLNKEYNKIHFIGIGGVSMSALALLLKDRGFSVQGSDNQQSKSTENLEKNGIKVYIGHNSENISEYVDLVVHTAAIKNDNQELVQAKQNNIDIIDRATLLGDVCKNYSVPIAVAGTHGKSTTTSLISKIFLENNLDPTISVGGFLKEINGNLRIGSDKYFIYEACEYYDSFLKFYPNIACILNVELDHVDYFNSLDDIIKSFNKFGKNLDENGYLIVNDNIDRLDEVLDGLSCQIFTVGSKEARLYANNIIFDDRGYPSFDVYFDNKFLVSLKTSQVGEHNIFNTLVAIAVSICADIDLNKAYESAQEFTGLDRRFQIKGEYKGCAIVDDYAHHPTEIIFALKAQREATKGKTYVVFQPHTYSRTKEFYKQFANSLALADVIILIDIYAAREINEYNISSKDILEILLENGKEAIYFDNNEMVVDYIKDCVKPQDSVITMGAGDVYKIGESVISN